MRSRWCALLVSLAVAGLVMVACVLPALGQSDREPVKPVTVRFKDVPVRNAVEMLFEGTGYSYAFEAGVQGMITLSLNDVPFADALSALLKTASLTMHRDGGIFMIGPQREFVETTAMPQLVPEQEVEIERAKIPERIPIGYADIQVIGEIFGVQPVGTLDSGYGGGGYGMGGMMGGMGGMMGGMGGMGGMMGGMGGYGGGMGGYGGGMGGYGGGGYGGGGYGGGGYGGGTPRW